MPSLVRTVSRAVFFRVCACACKSGRGIGREGSMRICGKYGWPARETTMPAALTWTRYELYHVYLPKRLRLTRYRPSYLRSSINVVSYFSSCACALGRGAGAGPGISGYRPRPGGAGQHHVRAIFADTAILCNTFCHSLTFACSLRQRKFFGSL